MSNFSIARDKFLSLNGLQEPCWSFKKRLLVLPIMLLAMVESVVWTLFFYLITRLLPKDHVWKKDRRLWPSSLIFYMAGTGCRYVKKTSMTWKALEYLYIWDQSTKGLKGYDKLISNIWNQLENVRATRNRLRNVKGQLYSEIERLLSQNKERIVICSLAAGSARGPIEVVADYLREFPDLQSRFTLVLIDFDEDAFSFAYKLAEEIYPGMSKIIKTHKALISQKEEKLVPLMELVSSYSPDIIEMVGFTDYMTSDKAVKILSAIHQVLKPGALFLTNNVGPNFERRFLEIVVTWKMLNRTEKQVLKLFESAGFSNVLTVWEATGIQTIYVARK